MQFSGPALVQHERVCLRRTSSTFVVAWNKLRSQTGHFQNLGKKTPIISQPS